MYDTILARSFSRHDQKKLGCGAFLGCFVIALSFCSLLKHLGPLPILNLSLSSGNGLKMLVLGETNLTRQVLSQQLVRDSRIGETVKNETRKNNTSVVMFEMKQNHTVPQQIPSVTDSQVPEKAGSSKTEKDESISCSFDQRRSNFCDINGDIRVQGSSSTVSIATSPTSTIGNSSRHLRPYARKEDIGAMSLVREWTVKPSQETPKCTINHNVTAVLFSTGGYAGNHFHAFSDVIIPLYLTSIELHGQVQFLVSDSYPSWTNKFREILKGLSNFELINIDRAQEVHCFPSIKLGLKHHKELSIDPSRSSLSMRGFRQFLRTSYSLNRSSAILDRAEGQRYKPRLLIISRKRSRSFTNSGSIAKMAKSLGFEVIVSEADLKLPRFAELVNSCDVVMGVHGAGLTNIVFLPENAVLIQVVPLGNMEWLSMTYFGVPAKDMNIRYLDYYIRERESTLIEQYPRDDVVLKDPSVLEKKGWEAFKAVYMDKQNVKLDVRGFRPTLLKALQLLRRPQR